MRPSLHFARIALALGLGCGVASAMACSGTQKGSPSGNGDDAAVDPDDSGAPASGPSSGGAGTSSGSGSPSGSGSGSSSSGSGAEHAADGGASSSTCTRADCDPHFCTVCVPQSGGLEAGTCEPGTTAVCGNNAATFHCASTADCASGEVCCGSFDLSAFTLTTACQKGTCPSPPPLCASGTQCQLCKQDSECGGGKCTDQSCGGNEVHFCTLNSFCTAL